MWKVEGKSSRVFLFGQFPIPKGINWLTSEVEQAFAECSEVWFENPDFDPRTAGAAVQKREALGGPKVVDVVGVADRKRMADLLAKAGRPADSLDGLLVWQAYLPLSDLGDAISGMDPASMPERVLKPRAKAEGKTIRSEWASMDEIMEFSASQTQQQQQLQLISKTLDDIQGAEALRAQAEAWARGDISTSIAEDEHFRTAYPELSARLVTLRNARWVARVESMLERNKSTFVCVGLGHLVGPESIQEHLRRAGHSAKRV